MRFEKMWNISSDLILSPDEIGIIESVKSVSNIIAPITGTVVEVNEQLSEQPDLVNQSPHEEGRHE